MATELIIELIINKLIYGINTIIKCGTSQPVKFQLVSFWSKIRNEIIFYSISELMLPTLIQIERKAMIWNRCNYLTPSVLDTKGKGHT